MTDRTTRSSNGRPHRWVAVEAPHGGLMNMRLEPDEDGRWVVTSLLIEGDRITADILRQVQLARVEATVSLMASKGIPPTEDLDDGLMLGELRTLLDRSPPIRYGSGGQDVIFAESRSDYPERKPLTRPDGTDDWYKNFAMIYRAAAALTKAPATILAAEAGAPVSAVHRWVREARRRGHLPPGRKGSAG